MSLYLIIKEGVHNRNDLVPTVPINMNCHKQIKHLEPTNLTKISYHRSTKKGHTGSKVVQPIRTLGTPDILPYAILVLLRLYVHFACACVFGASGRVFNSSKTCQSSTVQWQFTKLLVCILCWCTRDGTWSSTTHQQPLMIHMNPPTLHTSAHHVTKE